MMNQTYRTEFRRVFLLENLPEPLTRASYHQQIFDNYIGGTRLRLRSIRVPETKAWTWILQQQEPLADRSQRRVSEIHLNEIEHQAFEIFEGRNVEKNERIETNEIRKNRYFYDYAGKKIEIDMFLGEIWGLIIAVVRFEDQEKARAFEMFPAAIAEITDDDFFSGANLVGKTFADAQKKFSEK